MRRGADDVNWTRVCYFLYPWQLEVKESRYFTETVCQEINGQLIHITIGGVRLYVKENKAILENSSEDKDLDNDAKH